MPSAISIFCNPNRFIEQKRCSSQHVDYLDTKVEAAAKDLQPFTLIYTLNMSSPMFLLPQTGGHNICPCWSSPSCTQYRTSGAGTVERERERERERKKKTWKWCCGTCVSDTPFTAPRRQIERRQRKQHSRVPSERETGNLVSYCSSTYSPYVHFNEVMEDLPHCYS